MKNNLWNDVNDGEVMHKTSLLIFLVFKAGGSLEDRMTSEVFWLIILWEDESKVLFGTKIFFELGD